MKSVEPVDAALLRTFVATLASVSIQSIPLVMMALAKNGELALLRAVLERRLVDPAQFVGNKAMQIAIVPLAAAETRAPREDALDLIHAWFAAFGVRADAVLSPWLASCNNVHVAAGLLALGADPLWREPGEEGTVLHSALFYGQEDVARVLLDDCLRRGRLPVCKPDCATTAFDWMAELDLRDDPGKSALANHVVAQPLPWSWRSAIGQALLKADKNIFGPRGSDPYVPRLFSLMSAADLGASEWHELLSQKRDDLQFSTLLAKRSAHAALAATVVARFCAAGLAPDALAAQMPDSKMPGTMLQVAVLADNAPLVAALLQAGADPHRDVAVDGGEPRDCFALAKAGSEAAGILSAWRARAAMARALADARLTEAVGVLMERAIRQARLPDLVRDLAGTGRIDDLDMILGAHRRVLDNWFGCAEMAYAIAPLLVSVTPELRARAYELVRRWIGSIDTGLAGTFNLGQQRAMNAYLAGSDHPGVVAGLLALGADPLGCVSGSTFDALQSAIHNGRFDVTRLMLDHCLAPGAVSDFSALDSMFEQLAVHRRLSQSAFKLRVLERLACRGLPAPARRSAGRALLKTCQGDFSPWNERYNAQVRHTTKRVLTMMTLADLDLQQWYELLAKGHTGTQMLLVLAMPAPDLADLAATAITSLAAAGVDLDLLPVGLSVQSDAVTMLQAAILDDNVQIVSTLLEAGADPHLVLAARQCDGFALAAGQPKVGPVLLAWRARQAMNAALERHPCQCKAAE